MYVRTYVCICACVCAGNPRTSLSVGMNVVMHSAWAPVCLFACDCVRASVRVSMGMSVCLSWVHACIHVCIFKRP